MDTDLLNDPLYVNVLLERTARVHDTITLGSDGFVPLSPWSWTRLLVYSQRQWERLATATLYARLLQRGI
jgi:hypothetical protein